MYIISMLQKNFCGNNKLKYTIPKYSPSYGLENIKINQMGIKMQNFWKTKHMQKHICVNFVLKFCENHAIWTDGTI